MERWLSGPNADEYLAGTKSAQGARSQHFLKSALGG